MRRRSYRNRRAARATLGRRIGPEAPTPLAVTYTIDPARRLVVSVASGLVSAEDFLEQGKRLAEDPLFEPSFDQILDLRAATHDRAPDARP